MAFRQFSPFSLTLNQKDKIAIFKHYGILCISRIKGMLSECILLNEQLFLFSNFTVKTISFLMTKWNMLCTLSSICNIELTHQNNNTDVDIYHLVTLFWLRTNSLFLLYFVMLLAQLSRRIYKFKIFWSKTRGQITMFLWELNV